MVLEELLADPAMKSEQIRVQAQIALAATEGEAGLKEASAGLVQRALAEAPAGPARDEARQQECLQAKTVPVCLEVKAELQAHRNLSFLPHVQMALAQAYLQVGKKELAGAELAGALAGFERQGSRHNIFYVRVLQLAAGTGTPEVAAEAWRRLATSWAAADRRQYLSRGPLRRWVQEAGLQLQ
jgi:hypothetical protein